jgi:NAD(P)-dependent dehydrogenase (short-subunit alcohol dehydrogenase family)
MTTLEARFGLSGKVAAVIGGTGHLCSALARAMVESGMQAYTLDLPETLARSPQGTTFLPCDVTSKDDLIRSRDAILKARGRVDVLVNGAGTNAPTPFFEISEQEFHQITQTHLLGVVYACQVFGEPMVKQRSGSIINFASVSAGPPLSKAFVYSTAKAGVFNLTQNLAREWATANVRVNALRPGFFPTDWSMTHFIDDERRAKILGHTPMGRFGKPDELVGAVLWLASDSASFVTGSLVTVDGGFTAMTI